MFQKIVPLYITYFIITKYYTHGRNHYKTKTEFCLKNNKKLYEINNSCQSINNSDNIELKKQKLIVPKNVSKCESSKSCQM